MSTRNLKHFINSRSGQTVIVLLLNFIICLPNLFIALRVRYWLEAVLIYIFSFLLVLSFQILGRAKRVFLILSPLLILGYAELICLFVVKSRVTFEIFYVTFNASKEEIFSFISTVDIYVFAFGIGIIIYFLLINFLNQDFKIIKCTSRRLKIFYIVTITTYTLFPLYKKTFASENIIIGNVIYTKTFPFYFFKQFRLFYNRGERDFEICEENKHIISDSLNRKIILILGESSRIQNWSIFDYKRETNPLLKVRHDILTFPKVYSRENVTFKVYKDIFLKETDSCNISFMHKYKAQGYSCIWINNQPELPSNLVDIYKVCDTIINTYIQEVANYDEYIIPTLLRLIKNKEKQLFVVSSQGSHFRYSDKYPPYFNKFKPSTLDITAYRIGEDNREELLNSYDNSILYTDYFLNTMIDSLKKINGDIFMLYISDHGENLIDDSLKLRFHGTKYYTKYEHRIPMIVWYSEEFKFNNNSFVDSLELLHSNIFCSSDIPNLMLNLQGNNLGKYSLINIFRETMDSAKMNSDSSYLYFK